MAGASEHASAGRVPFWVHQLTEMLLGMLLLVQGARTGEHTAVLVSLGGVLVLLAICSDGALGAWPWIGRRLHRVLDVVAAVILAVSPLVLGLHHVFAIVVLEVAALAMAWMAFRTDWRPRARPSRKAARTAPAPPPTPPPTPAPTPSPAPRSVPPTSTPAAGAPGPPLARKLGAAAGRVRDDGPRTLGRWVGRARDATRSALTPPEEPPQAPPEAGEPTPPA
jgi:hypothetical protein